MPDLTIRPAVPSDVPVLHAFVVGLARDEGFPGEVEASEKDLRTALFGDSPIAEALLLVVGDEPAGFALYYLAYSTITGRPTLHLEDLFVLAEHRGRGHGDRALRHLAAVAVERGCGRFEWRVLRTNEDAIRFYRRLGARELDEIETMRVDGAALQALASPAADPVG